MQRLHVHVVAKPSHGGAADVGWIDAIADRVDSHPIDRLSTGDVLGNHLECFVALGYLAARTRRVQIGPLITTAAARDVGLLASAALSLDAVTRGRAYMILGRGDGIVRNLDVREQTVAELRRSIVSVRELIESGTSDVDGRYVRIPWPSRASVRVPLYTAPGGPRMLAMSLDVCDGVYLATGCTAEEVERSRAVIDGARRDRPLDVWWVTRFGIGDTVEDAYAVVAEGLASMGNHSLRGDPASRGVPRELWKPLAEFHRRFSYERKNALPGERLGGPSNVDLMNELGLRDYFTDRFGIVGAPDMVVDRLRELEQRGVHSVTMLAESAHEIDLIGTEIIPRLAATPD